MSFQDEHYQDLYLCPDGTKVEVQDLICSKCGRKADEMDEESDTVLWCSCGEKFYHVIWGIEEYIDKFGKDLDLD